MKKPKIGNYLFFFILLFSILIFFSFFQYFQIFKIELSDKENEWIIFSQFIAGPISAIISFGTLGITSLIAYFFGKYQNLEQNRHSIFNLFREFSNDKNLKARNNAWKFKKIWNEFSELGCREKIVLAMIKEENMTLTGKNAKKVTIKLKYIQGVYDLLSFYSMLRDYHTSTQNIQAVNYFYYGWWRKFLYEVVDLYDKMRLSNVNPNIDQIKEFDSKKFKENITFKPKLRDLDKLCGFDKLQEDFEIYTENN